MLFFCAFRFFQALVLLYKWTFGLSPKNEVQISYYILSDDYEQDEIPDLKRVPEDCILIEEWIKGDTKKCMLFYEGEEIFRNVYNPYDLKPFVPWLWIGDKTTEVDLTAALQKYIAVGNTIRLDLILHMIQAHHDTEIMYIDARTLEEVKFPDHGIRIVQDVSPPEPTV